MASRSAARAPADANQRKQALDTGRSFIVQAPAGSGKTELLIQRYLALLARVDEPESILAITFTRKAAGEMRGRVLEALRAAEFGEPPAEAHARLTYELGQAALEQDRQRGWGLPADPSRLRIQTIDAFCLGITVRLPVASRLGGAPLVEDDCRALYRAAAHNTILRLEGDDKTAQAVEMLALHLDARLDQAEELLAGMLSRRDQWLRHIGSGREDREAVRASLEMSFRKLIEARLRQTLELITTRDRPRLLGFARFAAWNLVSDASPALAALNERSEFPTAEGSSLTSWRGVCELLLVRAEDAFRKAVNKNNGFPPRARETRDFTSYLKSLAGNAPLLSALAEIRRLPEAHYPDGQWRILDALLDLLPAATAELATVFQRRGQMDFIEIAMRARAALGTPEEPTDLGLALGERIGHILVDEFQDTSVSQKELLEILTASWDEERRQTLFAVGDPMQSIYRFRKAEVGLFLAMRTAGLPTVRPDGLTLSTNFRSLASIAQWANEVFGKVFPAHEDIARGAVPYTPFTPFREEEDPGAVCVHPMIGRDDLREAGLAADLIAEAQKRHREGTIGVLVRARDHLVELARELQSRGIRFRAVEIDPLGGRPVAQDLLALTRALLHPADRVAWLACLRAPWCGLSLTDLHTIAGNDPHCTVWESIRRPDLALAPEAMRRLDRTRSVLSDAMEQKGRLPLRLWVESAWLRLGGPACHAHEDDLQHAEQFFAMLARLDGGGGVAAAADLEQSLEGLFAAADPLADGRLQLLTIHKAKGLEFDTVILPGLGKETRGDDPALLRWTEIALGPETLLLLAAKEARSGASDAHYDYLGALEKEKAEMESQRLLYVAATRARRRLHLIGHVEVSQNDGGNWVMGTPASGSLLRWIWPAAQAEFEKAFEQWRPASGEVGVEDEKRRRSPQVLRRLADGWVLPAPPPAAPRRAAALDQVSTTEPIPFDWVGDTLRHAGTVVHAWLHQIALEGVEKWTGERVDAQRKAFENHLATLGVPGDELAAAATRVAEALQNTLADPRGRWVLRRRAADQREYALAGEVDGRVVHRVIDCTFVEEDGVRWIIDFKTSIHEGGGLEGFLDMQVERYRGQMDEYAALIRRIDERPIRIGLYFPLLQGWREWVHSSGAAAA